MFRRLTILAAAIAALGAGAVLPASAGATKPCPIAYCTDSNGKYVLEVPPLTDNPFLAEYADCVWNVHVDFGDGTSGDYVFDAAVGLTGSHVFPTPGTKYAVTIALSEGHHGQTADPCPDYGQGAEVLYRTPAEEADDPPPPQGPWVPVEQGSIVPAPIAVLPDSSTYTPWAPPGELLAAPVPAPYWQDCGGSVRAHLVGCRKSRVVARLAGGVLTRPGSAGVAGFACRRRPALPIVCRHGAQRISLPPRG